MQFKLFTPTTWLFSILPGTSISKLLLSWDAVSHRTKYDYENKPIVQIEPDLVQHKHQF